MTTLRPYQARALRALSGPGFRVGGTRGVCSERCYVQLRAAGYLEEHWTWASTTRPDCGLSATGRAALAEYETDITPTPKKETRQMFKAIAAAALLATSLAVPALAGPQQYEGKITGIMPEVSSPGDYPNIAQGVRCLAFGLDNAEPGRIFIVPLTGLPSYERAASFVEQAFLTNTSIAFDVLPASSRSCGMPQAVRIRAGARVIH